MSSEHLASHDHETEKEAIPGGAKGAAAVIVHHDADATLRERCWSFLLHVPSETWVKLFELLGLVLVFIVATAFGQVNWSMARHDSCTAMLSTLDWILIAAASLHVHVNCFAIP